MKNKWWIEERARKLQIGQQQCEKIPLLLQHDSSSKIGTIEKEIEDGKIIVTLQFLKDAPLLKKYGLSML